MQNGNGVIRKMNLMNSWLPVIEMFHTKNISLFKKDLFLLISKLYECFRNMYSFASSYSF